MADHYRPNWKFAAAWDCPHCGKHGQLFAMTREQLERGVVFAHRHQSPTCRAEVGEPQMLKVGK